MKSWKTWAAACVCLLNWRVAVSRSKPSCPRWRCGAPSPSLPAKCRTKDADCLSSSSQRDNPCLFRESLRNFNPFPHLIIMNTTAPRTQLSGFHHAYAPGESERTLLLLHGTGGNEHDLLPLGRSLDPKAALLSPRGMVLEHGMPRFFRRLAEGVFDEEDLVNRAAELAEFIGAAAAEYGRNPRNI